MAQIGIFVGTVYGSALLAAEEVKLVLIKQGHNVMIFENGNLKEWQAYQKLVILIITSTTGQGQLPNNIVPLFQQVNKLSHQPALRYGIIALGDSSYDTFCGAGHIFDKLLQKQGATRVGNILEVDRIEHSNPEALVCCWAAEWGALL